MKGGPRDPIYKEKGNRGREKQGAQGMIIQRFGRLDFRGVSKERDLLRFGLCVVLIAGDVTAGYHNPRR